MGKVIDIRIKVPVRNDQNDPGVEMPPEYSRYGEIYHNGGAANATLEELLEEKRRCGIGGSVLQAEHEFGEPAQWNDRVAELMAAHPEEFICGWGLVNPTHNMAAVREIERCYHELGLRGIIFEPGFLDISPTDARCYPIYAKCIELGIPVGLHSGVNFSSHGPLIHERPVLIDQVACHFPELTLIAHHGGWPWPHEMAAVAWKHRNVYLEFGAIAPGYMRPGAGGGWGDIVHLMDTVLREKILFGTDWPMLHYDRALVEIDELELREASREAYLHGNAERLIEAAAG
ncbi:MAG: amidohydrolase family protein [Solirubrobacteraceae bacterium]|jgi:predicted TIM-barrel fold metal-dependent hydrolase